MEPSQSVIFVSCTDESPDVIIKLVFGDLPDGNQVEPGITSYPWHLNTKYYEADISLCAMQNKSLSSASFASSVQGIIIYFDSEKPNSLKLIEEWLTFLKEYEAEIKILLCTGCKEKSETGFDKLKIQKWCMKKEFELIEINPDVGELEAEQDFAETTGVKRVSQALEAHFWTNMTLKDRKEPTTLSGLWHGGVCESIANDCDKGEMNWLGTDNIEPSLEELTEGNVVDFCDLFSQLSSMKERASNLSNEERKKYAERVVLAYWNAIGGSEDEILDC